MLDLSARKVYGALAEQCVGGDAKADKVENATPGHLAGLDSNGNLTDSGVSPTEDVTVEGNPVTFDSPFEQDAKSVVVSVKPIQDLHGYDHPWPAGGGKNKFIGGNGGSQGGVTITKNSDGSYSFNGTSTEHVVFTIAGEYYLPNGSYILSGGTSDIHIGFSYGSERADDTGGGISFSISDEKISWVQFVIPTGVNTTGKTIYPMVRLATESDATFAPYSNICPISGIDEVEIEVSGKNLLPLRNEAYTDKGVTISPIYDNDGRHIGYDLDGTATGSFDYWFAGNLGLTAGIARYITTGLETAVQGFQLVFSPDYSGVQTNAVITSAFDGAFLNIGSGAVFNHVKIYPMLCLNSESDKSFEPYNPNSHTTTIPLPSTLYDADVDVTEGDADETHGIVDFSTLTWTLVSGNRWFANASNVKAVSNSQIFNGLCEKYEPVSADDLYFNENKYGSAINSSGEILVRNGSTTDAPTGQFCYELATPTTISFDPTDVELLEGTNVVSANAEKVAVTYGRSLWQDIDELKTDTEGKLDKSDVADIEGDTASRPYSVNEFMLRADGFYRVTQPIAQNASITASNTTKTTIGAVLTALLNA